MVSVPAEVDKSSPRSRVVSPIRIKVPVGSIRPPTPVKFQRSVPKVDTPLVVVHEQIRKKSPVKENLRHVHRSSAHLNDLDFACGNPPRRSKMHRIKTTTGSSAAPPAATTAPKEPETFSCGEDSIVLHTSDARRCPSWCDEKASRLLRQSLLVLERGRRISVTRYKPDFVSLSLTVNSVVYSASAIITSDELVHQQQKREAQLLHNEAKDGKENNNGRVRSEEGPSGHSPPVDVGWGRGEDASINSVSSAPDQKTTILANKQLPDATTALASSPATNPTTRRGRTVKRNSRLADYLVGERMLKKCEEQAEQQARERNRRVEIEYARQWHEIRSQLTGATPNASNGTTNQQQKEPGQTVPLTTSARSGCYAVPGSIESFSSSDLDHDAEDQDGGAAYGRNKDRGANVTVCDEESSHDRSVDEPYDLDGGLEDVLERVVLPQEGDDQSEEEYGVYPGITTASQEDYGDTIAPVSFPLELHESRQLEKSVSSVFCAGEEAERVKGHESAPELSASQRRMGSKRVVDDHSIMRRMLMDMPCRRVPKERKERRVIVDPRVEDVTAEEIKILEEINDLLYDDPGVVTADQLLFDFRKSFCIEVRNQIQLLRYKKLLLQRNSQLKLALSHAMATLPMHTASSGGPSTSKKPTNTLVGNAPRTVSEGVFKVPFAPGVKPLVTSRQQQQQRQRQTLVRPTQMPAVVSPVRRAALAGSPGRTHINPARVGLASRRQLLAKRANPMTGSEVNGYHFLKFNVRPRLTPSRSHFISSASPSAPKDSANSLDSEASEVLCPSVRAASLREVGRPGGAVRPVCSPPQRSPPSLTVHPPSPQFTNVSGSGCATSLPQVVPVSPIIPSEQLHMLMQPPTGRLVSVEAKKPTDEMFVTDVDRSGLPWTSGSSLPAPGAPKASDVAGVALQQSTSYAMHPMVTTAVEAPLHIHRPRIIKKFVRVKRTVPLFNTGSGPPAAVGVQTRPGSPVQLFRIVSPPRHLPLVRSSGPVASIAGHRVMAPLTRYAVQNVTPQLSGLVNGEGQTDNSFREGIVAFTEEDGSTVTKTLSGPDGSVICLRDGLTSMNESVGPLTENSALDGQDGATPQALQSATDTTVTSALPSKVAVVRGFRPLRTVVRCPQVVSTKRVRALSMANPMKFASPRRHFRLVGPASFTSAVGTSAGVVAKACGQKVTILSAPKVSVVRSSPPAVITIADDA
ncbi:hypothetical protein BIW11_04512 [Tropilaelaps mercedesae]|uniref:Uncharacterized protein n=1 Tax=Tropilaelaps mercedesae TaxID=418985 RepID=A0A1V9X4Z4_9ACAR|nr:hypothetical protein BIW11_04512 [Tropilaelaps mercedesae]